MNAPVKILHLEGESSLAVLVREELKKSSLAFEYIWVKNKSEFEKELVSFVPDVLLSNLQLAFLISKATLSILKNIRLSVPLILIAEKYTEENEDRLVKADADDYLFMDRLGRLPMAISNALKRSKAEKGLRGSHAEVIGNEKKFRTLIENIADAILLVDAKGVITYQSHSAERISGFPQAEALGRSIFEFTHPADMALRTRHFKQVLLSPGLSLPTLYSIRRKGGDFIQVEGAITNFLHDTHVNAIVISYSDITERKLAEDKLKKSEANLRTIFDNTAISYVLADRQYQVLSFNSSAFFTYIKEFKVELKEGDNLLDYLPESRKKKSIERFEKVLRGEKVNYELHFIQPEGNLTWYNVNMFAVRDDTDTLLGFIISSENITDRKRIELERSKMLSDIVQHNKDLEQFAYIISHNLRSPVANILGISALLESSPDMDKESFEKCMSGLTLSVKKLDEVIVDLNYILQTRREINEKKEMVSFSELVSDIKTSISGIIEKENITISTHFGVDRFFTLKSYLYSIFFNLIYNSIKYRNPSVPTVIDVQSRRINNKIVLEFRDNGLGIDLNAHGKTIFGLYKKFHKHIEGKGMGLYMVKTQVEILGGKISIASEVNKGTTFIIEFEE